MFVPQGVVNGHSESYEYRHPSIGAIGTGLRLRLLLSLVSGPNAVVAVSWVTGGLDLRRSSKFRQSAIYHNLPLRMGGS